jgi:hypothetical protein
MVDSEMVKSMVLKINENENLLRNITNKNLKLISDAV